MLLSICIPTYNRKDKLLITLDFFCKELTGIIGESFELVVGDNCSNDGTEEAVMPFIEKYPFASIIKNNENLGLVGNVINLSKIAKGKYVWLVGDDDVYYKGIVKEVFSRLKTDSPALLFINHKAYIEGQKDTSGFMSAVDLKKPDIYDDGHEGIIDIWKESETSLMFISCIVYEKEHLVSAISKEKVFNLASPLFYSFYVGSKGRVSIIKNLFIENIWGNTSWASKLDMVFLKCIPKILFSLYKWNYRFIDQFNILRKYLWTRKRDLIKCLLH